MLFARDNVFAVIWIVPSVVVSNSMSAIKLDMNVWIKFSFASSVFLQKGIQLKCTSPQKQAHYWPQLQIRIERIVAVFNFRVHETYFEHYRPHVIYNVINYSNWNWHAPFGYGLSNQIWKRSVWGWVENLRKTQKLPEKSKKTVDHAKNTVLSTFFWF